MEKVESNRKIRCWIVIRIIIINTKFHDKVINETSTLCKHFFLCNISVMKNKETKRNRVKAT